MILTNSLTNKEKIYLIEMFNSSDVSQTKIDLDTLSSVKQGVFPALLEFWRSKLDHRKIRALNNIIEKTRYSQERES